MKYAIFLVVVLFGCKPSTNMSSVTIHAFRLKPGEDLKAGIDSVVKRERISAGWIMTCVGSLTQTAIRYANQSGADSLSGHFEIVSLTGTVSVNGNHIHIAVSDSTGKTIGGHLMPGNTVYTTAEIVIGETKDLSFIREKDGTTPWPELQVRKVK
jgi:predicted DNA-binding protein with PD1-like motif